MRTATHTPTPNIPVPIAPVVNAHPLSAAAAEGEITLTGRGEPGAQIELLVDGELAGRVVAGPDGTWSQAVTLGPGGVHTVIPRMVTEAGVLVVQGEPVSLTAAASATATSTATTSLEPSAMPAASTTSPVLATATPGLAVAPAVLGQQTHAAPTLVPSFAKPEAPAVQAPAALIPEATARPAGETQTPSSTQATRPAEHAAPTGTTAVGARPADRLPVTGASPGDGTVVWIVPVLVLAARRARGRAEEIEFASPQICQPR